MAITREDYVTQSVAIFLQSLLESKGFGSDVVELVNSFDTERFKEQPMKKTFVAVGFNFDDGGKEGELGSTLKRRLYTIEFFIIGKSDTWGKNVAQAVKFSLERDGTIPLLDITQASKPEIDRLIVISASAEHQPIAKPEPWQENIWTVHLRAEDFYDPSQAVS